MRVIIEFCFSSQWLLIATLFAFGLGDARANACNPLDDISDFWEFAASLLDQDKLPAMSHRPVLCMGERRVAQHMALVIDCHTQQLLGWHLSQTGKASITSAT